MAFDPFRLIPRRSMRTQEAQVPLTGDRSESIQRLQIGFFGLGSMILLVGLANIIMNSVQESQATAVPEAAPTVAASQAPAPSRDPLADAGVVPDLPAEAEPDEPEAGRSIVRQPPAVPGIGNVLPSPRP